MCHWIIFRMLFYITLGIPWSIFAFLRPKINKFKKKSFGLYYTNQENKKQNFKFEKNVFKFFFARFVPILS